MRDAEELRACSLGIRALGLMPMPTQRLQAGMRDIPVQIEDVWLRPGDWLYADADGVVISSHPLHSEK